MKKNLYALRMAAILLMAVVATGMALMSCDKETPVQGPERPSLKATECLESVYTLYAGQTINAGTLTIWNDAETLYITYQITNPDPALAMNEIHLWAGTDLALCPETKTGNPKIGQFPYYASATTSIPAGNPLLTDPLHYSLQIPLADLGVTCDQTLYVAAHAAALTETMWGEGIEFNPGGNWATYSTYTVCCVGEEK